MALWRDLSNSGGTPELNDTISDLLGGFGVKWDGSAQSFADLYSKLGIFCRESDNLMIKSMNGAIQDVYTRQTYTPSSSGVVGEHEIEESHRRRRAENAEYIRRLDLERTQDPDLFPPSSVVDYQLLKPASPVRRGSQDFGFESDANLSPMRRRRRSQDFGSSAPSLKLRTFGGLVVLLVLILPRLFNTVPLLGNGPPLRQSTPGVAKNEILRKYTDLLPPNPTMDDINHVYRVLARKYHADKGGNDEDFRQLEIVKHQLSCFLGAEKSCTELKSFGIEYSA